MPAKITFPLPAQDAAAYATDPVYRAMYDVMVSERLEVLFPLPSGCPEYLESAPAAIQAYLVQVEVQTNIRNIVSSFDSRYNISGFDAASFIAYFSTTVAPSTTTAMPTMRPTTVAPAPTMAPVTIHPNGTNASTPTATSGSTTAPTTTAPTTTPPPTLNRVVMLLERDIMRHVNVRDLWLSTNPQCFVTLTESPSTPTTAAPVTARVFSADLIDPASYNETQFRAALTTYFEAVGPVPEFTLRRDGNKVIITITSQGELGELGAAALQNMPAGEQSNLGVTGMAPEEQKKDDDKKKFPMWVIGVIVGAVVVLAVVGLVISRRTASRSTGSVSQTNVGAFDSELASNTGNYQQV
jgi:hypothetical protein